MHLNKLSPVLFFQKFEMPKIIGYIDIYNVIILKYEVCFKYKIFNGISDT